MKGIPNKNNFLVSIVSTNEKKEFKTLSEIAKEYNINYYTARELNRLSENETEKHFLHKLLAAVFDKIKIYTIKDNLNI